MYFYYTQISKSIKAYKGFSKTKKIVGGYEQDNSNYFGSILIYNLLILLQIRLNNNDIFIANCKRYSQVQHNKQLAFFTNNDIRGASKFKLEQFRGIQETVEVKSHFGACGLMFQCFQFRFSFVSIFKNILRTPTYNGKPTHY